MFVQLLACLLLVNGISGIPTFTDENQEGRTLNWEDWNPLNLFGNKKDDEKNETKLQALYQTIDCILKSDPKDCGKFIDQARKYFEPKKELTTNSTTVAPTKPPQ